MLRTLYSRLDKVKLTYLTALLIFIIAAEIILTALIPMWREYFYNILEQKNANLFTSSLIYFTALMAGLGAVQGLKVWIGQLISFSVRFAATKILFKRWVKGSKTQDNYTQSMTEALRNATELYLQIAVEITISASIVVLLMIQNFHHTSIVLASIIYTVVVSVMAGIFNRPLMTSDRNWQAAEGHLRETISDIANNQHNYTYKEKLQKVVETYATYIRVVMYFTLFSRVKGALSSLVPYILLASSYFSGALTLGDFMSQVSIFELIVINSTIVLLMYPQLTKARVSYNLAKDFYHKTEEIKND